MRSAGLFSDQRRPPLGLLCLNVFLLVLPLTLSSPGLPAVETADAAAFYLAALSLWQDGDLVCDDRDVRRLFREYPGTENLLLVSGGQGQTVYFGVPLVYPLVSAPFVALLGAKGMVLLNAALLAAMVWMGFFYLRRHNDETLSVLFVAGYFVLSTTFVYVFWLQAEVFNMTCVMTAFYLVERGAGASVARRRTPRRLALSAAGAAMMLAAASYSKPMLAALVLPMLYLLFRARSWRGLAAFVGAGLLTAVAFAGSAKALTEETWPYFGHRASFDVSSPVDYMERKVAPRFFEGPPARPVRQISRAGEQLRFTMATNLRAAVSEFLIGRHGGFVLYMPFAVLAIIFFLLHDHRSVFRWLILAAAVLTAGLFVTLVRGNWLGGGAIVGNRLFIAAYPSFLFLVRRIHPPWLVAFGCGAAALFLGPILVTPRGMPNEQAHVLNQPFPHLPLEWSLARKLPSYQRIPKADIVFQGRRDEIKEHRDEIWIRGSRSVEVHLLGAHQQRDFVFDVRNLAPDNEIEICLQGLCRQLTFNDVPANGSVERLTFEALRGKSVPRAGSDAVAYRHRLTVTSKWGEQPRWRGSDRERFYLGAALMFLGTPDDLARDLFHVEWSSVEAPSSMIAGSTLAVPIALRNASSHRWPSAGPTRVKVSYHWLQEDGDVLIREGKRTNLPTDVAAGGMIRTEAQVDVPERAGRYVLAFDLIRERVSWFSDADQKQMYRMAVEVVAPAP